MTTRIVFLVSLPRSGSTLLQRMLSASPDVAASAEPWVMLPFWGMRQLGAGRAVYFHHTAANAINDFLSNLPDGEASFAQAVGQYGYTLYSAAARGRPVFLDKTPRYFLMLPLLRRAFPDAKFLLLLRHPLAVLASICETFNRGRFIWHEFWLDWLEGHARLADAVADHAPNQLIVRYEDLVIDSTKIVKEICEFLEIAPCEEMVAGFSRVELSGRMGDPTGVKRYAAVSGDSLERWRDFFSTAYRRRVAMQMLQRVPSPIWDTLGYPLEITRSQLHGSPARPGLDLRSRYDHLVGSAASLLDFRYWQARWRASVAKDPYAYGYYRGY